MDPSAATPVHFSRVKYGMPLAVDASSVPTWTGIVPDGQPHVLDFHEFLVIASGEADVSIGGRRVHVETPSVLVTPPHVVRRVRVSTPLDLQLVVFTDQALRRSAWSAALGGLAPGAVPVRSAATWSTLHAVARLMRDELRAPQSDSPLLLEALLAQFVITLRRSLGTADGPPVLVTRFERLIDRRFDGEHRVGAYATALGVTPDHLSATVRSYYGVSAKAVIDRRVFAAAARLLATTSLSIAEVGAAVGFDEPAHFTRFVTRCCGQSPTRLRRGH